MGKMGKGSEPAARNKKKKKRRSERCVKKQARHLAALMLEVATCVACGKSFGKPHKLAKHAAAAAAHGGACGRATAADLQKAASGAVLVKKGVQRASGRLQAQAEQARRSGAEEVDAARQLGLGGRALEAVGIIERSRQDESAV